MRQKRRNKVSSRGKGKRKGGPASIFLITLRSGKEEKERNTSPPNFPAGKGYERERQKGEILRVSTGRKVFLYHETEAEGNTTKRRFKPPRKEREEELLLSLDEKIASGGKGDGGTKSCGSAPVRKRKKREGGGSWLLYL